MSVKKKVITGVSYLAVASLAVGGTLAYLSDTDEAVNVAALGNIKIEQIEQQRVDDSDNQTVLEEFEQGKKLMPARYEGSSIPWAPEAEWVKSGDQAWKVVEDNNGVIDKFVTVKNTGGEAAYVRTIFAVEVGTDAENSEYLHLVTNGTNIKNGATWEWEWLTDANGKDIPVVIEGTTYALATATYTEALPAGTSTIPSLKQIYMDKDATNEVYEKYGDTLEILAFTQALQVENFEDLGPAAALNEEFGAITATSHPWIENINFAIVNVSDYESLQAAVDANRGKALTINLDEDVTETQVKIGTEDNVTIIGDATFTGQFMVTGKLALTGITVNDPSAAVEGMVSQYSKSAIALMNTGDVVCNDVTFEQELSDSTAITAWWSTGDGANITVKDCVFNCNGQRPIRSDACVTVESCTFNDPYRYAVQMTSKSGTMADDAEAYVNFKNNVIIAGTTPSKPVYGVQLEGGYGCSDLTINGSGNTIELGDTNKTSAMYYCECGAVDHNTIVWNTEVEPIHEG